MKNYIPSRYHVSAFPIIKQNILSSPALILHTFDHQYTWMKKYLAYRNILIIVFLCSAMNSMQAQNRSGYDYYYAALDQIDRHNYATSVILLDSAEAGGVDLYDLYNHRGISYFNLGFYEKALVNYNYILSQTSLYKSANINAANAYYKAGNLAMAANLARELHNEKEFDEFAYNITGCIFFSKQQYQQALDHYFKAIQLDSQMSSPYYNCGITYYALKQYDSAVFFHEIARALNPNDHENLYAMALALRALNRNSESLKLCYEILSRDSLNYRSYAEIANSLMDDPGYDPEVVSPYLQKSINMQPQRSWGAYTNMGDVYARKGMYEQALENYNKAIETNANNPKAYNARGDLYNDSAMYDYAMRDYLLARYYDPSDSYSNLALGSLMLRINKPDEANIYYNRYLELTPDKDLSAKLMNNSRASAELDGGAYEKALQSSSMALDIDPNYALALNIKGMAFAKLKLYDSALYYINRSVSVDPKNASAFHNRAYVYAKNNNNEQACNDLKHAFDLYYPGKTDAALIVLNQKKCHYNFINKSDTIAVKYDVVLNAFKNKSDSVELVKKKKAIEQMAISATSLTNVVFEKLDVIQLIAPNPATDEFTLQLKGRIGKPFIVNIVGMNGQSYRQYTFNELQKTAYTISCREWPVGTYGILLTAENKEIGKSRIVVLR